MVEDTDMPKRQHTRSKSSNHDVHYDSKLASTRPRLSRTQSRKNAETLSSDKATANFVRRTLCAHQIRTTSAGEGALPPPLEELLPPLTSSNDIDLQLYALVAIIIKDFVQTWYSKITPDQQFTDKVLQVIAHCTRGLEQRIRHVDTEALILDELPALINSHITAYRTVCLDHYASSLGSNKHELYHMFQAHPALSPVPKQQDQQSILEQAENEMVWRQLLVQTALLQLLPPEDLDNPCLKVLVTDVLSELILGNAVCGKVCNGWFIWEVATKLIELVRPNIEPTLQSPTSTPAPSRLEQFGLVSNESSGNNNKVDEPRAGLLDNSYGIFWQILQYSTMLFLGLRTFIVSMSDIASLPARSHFSDNLSYPSEDLLPNSMTAEEVSNQEIPQSMTKRPILGMSAWSCCSHLLSVDMRMPWVTAIFGFLQWLLIYGPGRVGCANSRLDRLISHHVATTILNPDRLPSLLLIVRTNLFPNNTLGQGRVPPTPNEVLEIKRRCASTIANALPPLVRSKLFPSQELPAIEREIEGMLDVFGDSYMNKHMMFAIVDLLFSRLFPEIQEQSISTLLYGE